MSEEEGRGGSGRGAYCIDLIHHYLLTNMRASPPLIALNQLRLRASDTISSLPVWLLHLPRWEPIGRKADSRSVLKACMTEAIRAFRGKG